VVRLANPNGRRPAYWKFISNEFRENNESSRPKNSLFFLHSLPLIASASGGLRAI
jgi:hypothetical protein